MNKQWTPEEEKLLRDIYPEHGIAGCYEALPHRSQSAIKNRVDLLRLRRK